MVAIFDDVPGARKCLPKYMIFQRAMYKKRRKYPIIHQFLFE